MEKIQKKAKKNPKSKKKQPLKIVYIANPIKFKTSASEFRALVQGLTGRDADTDTAVSFSGGGEAGKVAAEDNVHAEVEQLEVNKLGWRPSGGVVDPHDGYDPLADSFVSSLLIDSVQGWAQT